MKHCKLYTLGNVTSPCTGVSFCFVLHCMHSLQGCRQVGAGGMRHPKFSVFHTTT